MNLIHVLRWFDRPLPPLTKPTIQPRSFAEREWRIDREALNNARDNAQNFPRLIK